LYDQKRIISKDKRCKSQKYFGSFFICN